MNPWGWTRATNRPSVALSIRKKSTSAGTIDPVVMRPGATRPAELPQVRGVTGKRQRLTAVVSVLVKHYHLSARHTHGRDPIVPLPSYKRHISSCRERCAVERDMLVEHLRSNTPESVFVKEMYILILVTGSGSGGGDGKGEPAELWISGARCRFIDLKP